MNKLVQDIDAAIKKYHAEEYAYIVVELRPTADDEEYTDMAINNDHFTIHRMDACKDLTAAMYTAIDIERTQPTHKHITLHHESLQKLLAGIYGEYEPQPKRGVFKLLEQAKKQGLKV